MRKNLLRKNSLIEFLFENKGKDIVSFHMPGHKGGHIYEKLGYGEFLNNIIDFDITEITGADNLFQAEGVIENIMQAYKALYDSKKSYLLVNGSSVGIVASLMSVLSEDDTIIMARNSHKSVYNALSIIGAKPIYAHPKVLEDYGIAGEVTPKEIERCIKENTNAKAVIITSPNYYGICSDIKSISEIVHDAGMILVVDQAHGAHLKFFDEEKDESLIGDEALNVRSLDNKKYLSAENNGADLVINSTHKTLASFTQSAILNIMSDRVSIPDIEDALQKLETTSPSYVLMMSLDINAHILENSRSELIHQWIVELDRFYNLAKRIEGLKTMANSMLDYSKINLDMSALGLDGIELQKELEKRNIIPELSAGNVVMCMSGIGNNRRDYDRLLESLQDISDALKNNGTCYFGKNSDNDGIDLRRVYSDVDFIQKDIPKVKIELPIDDGIGKTCAQALIPYPPGIPVICPGEVITKELIEYIKELNKRGQMIMGLYEGNKIFVGK